VIWWLGLVSIVALAAFGAAWFQGYNIEIRRGGGTRDSSAEIYLRSINERLADLKDSQAVPVQGRASHSDATSVEHLRQMERLLARLDQLVSRVGVTSVGVNDGAFGQTSERLARLEHDFAANLGRLSEAVKEIHGLVSTLVLEAWQAQERHTPEAAPALEVPHPMPMERSQERLRPRQQTELARQSYLGLLNARLTDPDPLYLDTEGTSSVFGKFEDSNIYLQQVGHSQGTFVLFAEDDRVGHIFPNPALAYQEKALREVFPDLTEAKFNGAKQRIEPVRVVKVGERRWKVEHTILDID
jgi:hypothetical protein